MAPGAFSLPEAVCGASCEAYGAVVPHSRSRWRSSSSISALVRWSQRWAATR